jgi:Family of unknown function (DUF6350)
VAKTGAGRGNCDSCAVTAPTMPPSTHPAAAPGPRAPFAVRATSRARSIRAALRRFGRRGRNAPTWLIGPLAALWAAAIGLGLAAVPLLVVWMASPASGLTWGAALRVSGLVWVLAHGVPVAVAGTTYSLLPWGLVVIPLLLLGYAGGWAARRSRASTIKDVVTLVLTGTATYTAAGVVVVSFTAGMPASLALPRVVAHTSAAALLGLTWGAVRASGVASRGQLPPYLPVILRSGTIAALALVGFGALIATTSLVMHVDDAITMAQSMRAGLWGGFGLLLLCVAYVPVIAVWGAAYSLGAGVVIGPAVVVSPFVPVTAPTQLPPLPLLAALPHTASPLAWALPVAGVVAGVLAGLAVARGAREESRLVRLALAAGAAIVAGLLMAFAAYLASGSLGDLRLARIGPTPSTVGILAAVLVLLGAMPSAVAAAPPARAPLAVASDDVFVSGTDPENPRED